MFLLALLLQSASPAATVSPQTPPPLHGGPSEMTCPVGGERFSAWRPTMYSTYGERPDGKPYSYLPFPFPLPECPTNKLIVFGDFSDEEGATLASEIATSDYKRLVDTETTYYRAYWLSMKLGQPKHESLGLLLSAIWQVSPGDMSALLSKKTDEHLRRYQELFVKEVQQLNATTASKDRVWLEARAANAARQMGKFHQARALRARASVSLASLSETGRWNSYLSKLEGAIARRDSSIEPLDMIPERQIPFTCMRERPSDAFGRAICAKPEVVARITEIRRTQQ